MVTILKRIFRIGGEGECGEVHRVSSDYLENETDSKIRDRIRRHLEWCKPCSAFVNTLRSTIDLLRTSPSREAPPNLQTNILGQVRREQKKD